MKMTLIRASRVCTLVACSATAMADPAATAPAAGTQADPTSAPAGVPSQPAPAVSTPAAKPGTAASTPSATASTMSGFEQERDKRLRRMGYKPRVRDGQTLYCRKEETLGTRFESTVCGTASDLDRATQDSKDITDKVQRTQLNPQGR